MFFNLTWRNAKRSRSENLIYFLTMITAVAMFYIVLSLGQQDVIRFLSEIESDAVERLLTNLLPTVYLCALLFVFFLVVFANKYQLECRSRELGLYLMFGMTKIKLFIQIMTEGLITSFLALLGGLVCGGFLSEAISLTTARLVGHGIITHQLSFSVSAAIFTSLGFLIIQFVALFVLCGKLFRKELHQLVYGEMAKKQRTGNPYVSFVSFAIGTVILLVAYWIVVEHFMAASGAMLLIAVLLGIIGTILFIRGLARILSIWAASIKHKATRGLYVFTLRQLHSEFVNSDTCMVYWNFCIPNELVETKGLMLPIMEARDLLKPSGLYYESYLNNFGRQLFYVISGSYTTLYMGFMFLIIACALLALQFLTQMEVVFYLTRIPLQFM